MASVIETRLSAYGHDGIRQIDAMSSARTLGAPMNPAELLSAIVGDPDDDVPRLAYADWLDENGDPRGEFIRVQCRLQRQDLPDDEQSSLQRREAQLLYRYGKLWAFDVVANVERRFVFERGFIERGELALQMSAEAILKTLETNPFRYIRDASQLTELQGLVDALPHLERLRGLELCWLYAFDDALLGKILQSRHLRSLKTLILHHDRNGNLADEQVIVDGLMSPYRSNIEVLAVNVDSAWRGPTNRILAAIAGSPYLRNLKRLHISNPGDVGHDPKLDIATVERLARSPNLEKLEVLDLRRTRCTKEVWQALLEMPFLRGLRVLYLEDSWEILPDGQLPSARKLVDVPHWRDAFDARVVEVDWAWRSIDPSDGSWPDSP